MVACRRSAERSLHPGGEGSTSDPHVQAGKGARAIPPSRQGLTLFSRSSCSDLWAERSCQRAIVCFNWHQRKACKSDSS